METLSPKLDAIILSRNNRYLENISTEHRPIILSQTDSTRLDNFIFRAVEDVFDVSREQMILGAKYQDEIRARIGTTETFRRLTSYSALEIGQRIGVSESSVVEYARKSRQLLQADIFYSAFVLTSSIKAFGMFYPSSQIPNNTRQIINLAVQPNSMLPFIRRVE